LLLLLLLSLLSEKHIMTWSPIWHMKYQSSHLLNSNWGCSCLYLTTSRLKKGSWFIHHNGQMIDKWLVRQNILFFVECREQIVLNCRVKWAFHEQRAESLSIYSTFISGTTWRSFRPRTKRWRIGHVRAHVHTHTHIHTCWVLLLTYISLYSEWIS